MGVAPRLGRLRRLSRYRGVMTAEEARSANLTTGKVARLLGLSQATVSRIPKERLDFWTTPGGHRRYRLEDVREYGRQWMGRSEQA